MDRLCTDEAVRRFDLERGPLIRVGLIQMRDNHSVLMLTVHHIVCDGWSIGIIVGEFAKIYAAFVEERNSPLPELPIQYPDYVVWKNEQHIENVRQLTYWKKKLQGCNQIEVPTDFPRTVHEENPGAILSVQLDRESSHALQQFNLQRNVTMYVTALATWSVLLQRLTGEEDIAVSSALAGRPRAELELLVGLFMNEITLRVDLSGDPTFTEVVDRARDTVWEAVANQDVPFEHVADALQREDKLVNPHARINFNCHRAYGGAGSFVLEFSGLKLATMPSKSQGALYDLNLFLIQRETGWRVSLEWNTELYAEARAQRILNDFCALLQEAVANPDRQVSRLSSEAVAKAPGLEAIESAEAGSRPDSPAMSADTGEADPSAPVSEMGQTEVYELPAGVTQERFWLLSRADPASAAFNMPSAVRIAGPLSHELLEKSFQCLEKRHEILRTTFRIADGKVIQRVAPAGRVELPLTALTDGNAGRVQDLLLDEARKVFDLEAGPVWRAHLFRLQPNEHVLSVTLHHIVSDGWSHNILQRELWSVYERLAGGGGSELPPLEIQYADYVVWQNEWLESDEAGKQLEFWLHKLTPPLPVVNFPIDCSPAERAGGHAAIETRRIPAELISQLRSVGQATQATMYMLTLAAFSLLLARYSDQFEMIVGSPSAKRRPETEPLIGPFSAPIPIRMDLSRCSKLRDVVKLATSATLDALDHTELPFEVLLKHVRARAAQGRSPLFQFYFLYQTAFLRPRQVLDMSVTPLPASGVGIPFELQLAIIERPDGVNANLEYNTNLFSSTRIGQVLDYFLYILEKMAADIDQPIADLTSPVDTSSCAPQIDASIPSTVDCPYVAPRNAAEEKLTQIWQEVLELPRIGIHDDFFASGGQSLLAARLFLEIEKRFGTALNISELIVAPTIEKLAQRLMGSLAAAHLVPLRTSGSRPALFCVHGGGGHLLHYRDLVAALDVNQPIYGLKAPELDGVQETTTVEDLAARYVAEIRKLQTQGPYHLCGLSFGGLVAYEMAVQLKAAGADVGIVALFDTGNPFYYRELSPLQAIEFHTTYFFDRVRKYARNLRAGQIRALAGDAGYFAWNHIERWTWKAVQRINRVTGTAMPKPLRNNVVMFSGIGRSYRPRPYSGTVVLFRAKGRTAEYGSNQTLGWDSVPGNEVVVLHVPGDHLTIMEFPQVESIASALTARLAAWNRAQGASW